MSLQFWLPMTNSVSKDIAGTTFDKTIPNYGIAKANFRLCSHVVYSQTGGKFNNCYYFDPGSTGISARMGIEYTENVYDKFTYCCWIYDNNTSSSTSSVEPALFYDKNKSLSISIYTYDNSKKLVINNTIFNSFTLPAQKWFHLSISYNGSSIKIYINGEKVHTVTATLPNNKNFNSEYIYIGKDSGVSVINEDVFKGYMNDFRLYDEALSDQQIKEIAQGLVAHYPLEGIKTNENLLLNSNVKNRNYSSTSYPCGRYELASNVVAGKTYTATVCASFSKAKTIAYFFGGGSYGTQFVSTVNDRTHIISWTFTATANMAAQSFVNVYVRDAQDSPTIGEATCILYWVKLEEGEVSTPWVLNSSEDPFVKGILGADTSGNEFNGTANGIFNYRYDSPRYESAAAFNGTNNYISIGRPMPTDELTCNIWAYMDNWTVMNGRPFSCTQGGGWNIETQSAGISPGLGVNINGSNVYTNNLGGSLAPLSELTSGWHMFTLTFDGIYKKLYIDGVLKGSTNGLQNGSTLTEKTPIFYHTSNSVLIGAEASTGSTPDGSYFNGALSDYRIYATALSAEDILELYKNKISMDRQGNLFENGIDENGKILAEADQWIGYTSQGAVFTRTTVTDKEAFNGNAALFECTTAGQGLYFGASQEPWVTGMNKFIEGKTYEISFYIKANFNHVFKFDVPCGDTGNKDYYLTDRYQKISYRFVYSSTTTYLSPTSYGGFEVGDKFWMHSVRIKEFDDTITSAISKTNVVNGNEFIENYGSVYLPLKENLTDKYNHITTAYGTTKFADNALNCNGDNALIVNYDSSLLINSKDWTISMWINRSSSSAWETLFELNGELVSGQTWASTALKFDNGNNRIEIKQRTGETTQDSGMYITNLNTEIPLGQWTHVAMVRDGETIRIFIGGIQKYSFITSTDFQFSKIGLPIYIGCCHSTTEGNFDAVQQFFSGKIKQFAFIKGQALWTENFTPPEQEISISSFGKDKVTAYDFYEI